ncbi:hypothetical protein GO491_08030 [Flavobacteriaceae bacterium Ap0902]|nr:hypothetical protein [Flavobacteriaceae bacterium Ap0902]
MDRANRTLFIPVGLFLFMDEIKALAKGVSLVGLFLPAIGIILLLIIKLKYCVSWREILYVESWRKEWKSMLLFFTIAIILYSWGYLVLYAIIFLAVSKRKVWFMVNRNVSLSSIICAPTKDYILAAFLY